MQSHIIPHTSELTHRINFDIINSVDLYRPWSVPDTMADFDFDTVPGNDELKRFFTREIKRGSLGHAYMIEGAPGIGKRALADAAAAALLAGGDDTIRHRIAAGSHPDVRVIGRDGRATIGVDTIRELRSDAHIIPSESERKVYIIEDADTMTVEAQNAFLLSLEEPPPYVLYLLLCSDSKALLETIRSRAPSLRMCPCDDDTLSEYLCRVGGTKASLLRSHEPEMWAELLAAAGGNPGTARSLLDERTLLARIESKRTAERLITSILRGDDDVLIEIATMKKAKRDTTLETLTDIESALRDMLLSKKTLSFDTCFFISPEAASEVSVNFPARKLALAADAVRAAYAEVSANAAVTTALLSMAIRIKNS